MFAISRLRMPALVLATLAFGACQDNNGPTSQNQNNQPHVTVRLTDAAGDVKAAVVTISEIDLEGGPNGKVILMSTPVTTDLLTLANTTATLVDNATVPAGTYSEMRFVITGGYVEVDNGNGGSDFYASSPTYSGLPAGTTVTGDLQMPSLAQSGLKVDFGSITLNITADQDFLVDFDVSKSFGHLAGNSGKWVMHPVITGGVVTTSGTILATLKLATGITLPLVGGNTVTLAAFKADLNGQTVDFTDPDADGTFEARFRFLAPGTYALNLVVPTGLTVTTAPVLPVQVQATAGATTTQAITIQTATSP
jgi:Domain of unknown function (DUF4382)